TGCFSGEAFLNWDPCGNLTSMTASNGTLVASYEYDKAYSKKINEYNPYGVEMPFQYKGRDGTVTPTYGGATPLNVDMHIYSGSRISIGNLAPVQAPDKLVCYIDGYSEDPMSPVDGGSEDDCDDEEDDCDVDCEKGYKEGFTSVTDLCRCKESEGKVPGFRYGDVKDLDCDGLKEMMANEKADWEYHVNGEETGDLDKDDKYHGKIENLVDVLFYIGNPNKDYSCGTLARSGCLYWSAKEALEKKIASGECQ
ncbi:MAG: hypothetical protein KAH01_00230, partial [Caldisericia bacterium]|nr:hypothetical protein [Caldisericia bacterium]